jgi:hypothetical protein
MSLEDELLDVLLEQIIKIESRLEPVLKKEFGVVDKPKAINEYRQSHAEWNTGVKTNDLPDNSTIYLDNKIKIACAIALHFIELAKKSLIDPHNFCKAIQYINDASGFVGVTMATNLSSVLQAEIRSENAKKGHAIDNEIKIAAMEYYAANLKGLVTKEKAAELIEAKFDRKYRTVRDWITEYHKK